MPTTAQDQSAQVVEKIIATGLWLMNNHRIAGKFISELVGGVTNVTQWVNHTGMDLEVFKGTGNNVEDHYKIPAGQTRSAQMWLPWAENSGEYRSKRATFLLGGKPFVYVWQSRKIVRFNVVDAYVQYGPMVPGACGAGGERCATFDVGPDGQPALVLSKL